MSVQLPGGKVAPAKDVEFKSPRSPFKEITSANSDKTWLSEKSGNTLSYLSECGNKNEPSLKQIESESLGALTNLQQLKSTELTFNGRAARLSTNKGDLDGVPVQIALLIFKKNGCNYTLSYGGVDSKFSEEEHYFSTFLESFKAP